MITIDDKKYTEEDLSDAQIAQVKRIDALRNELDHLSLQAQEINVLINAYASAIKEGFEEEE